MPVESPEELAIFFDPRDFGVEGGALYAPRDRSAPYIVQGIFDEGGVNFNPNRWPGHPYQKQEGASLQSTGPTFQCAAADLVKGGKLRDNLTIGGVLWRVQEALQDGTGAVVLKLVEDEEGAPL